MLQSRWGYHNWATTRCGRCRKTWSIGSDRSSSRPFDTCAPRTGPFSRCRTCRRRSRCSTSSLSTDTNQQGRFDTERPAWDRDSRYSTSRTRRSTLRSSSTRRCRRYQEIPALQVRQTNPRLFFQTLNPPRLMMRPDSPLARHRRRPAVHPAEPDHGRGERPRAPPQGTGREPVPRGAGGQRQLVVQAVGQAYRVQGARALLRQDSSSRAR